MIQANRHFSSVAVWGTLQLGVLGIGAFGFPMWAHHPFPRESLALPILICSQVVLVALQLPVLSATAGSLSLGLLLMLPIDELAGLLSNSSQAFILTSFGWVGVWIVGLAGWARILRDPKSKHLLSGLATIWTVGGVVIDYLRSESAALAGSTFTPVSLFCKLSRMNEIPWLQIGFPALSALIIIVIRRAIGQTPKPRTTSFHIDT